jgi:hypothetical protein
MSASGNPPPLTNPLAPPGRENDPYRVEVGRLGGTTGRRIPVRLGGAMLSESRVAVNDVTFGPLGGTGPGRSEDTIVRLTGPSGDGTQAVRLTVSWVTGQVWIDRIE